MDWYCKAPKLNVGSVDIWRVTILGISTKTMLSIPIDRKSGGISEWYHTIAPLFTSLLSKCLLDLERSP